MPLSIESQKEELPTKYTQRQPTTDIMTNNQHTTRYYPATKKDHELNAEEILKNESPEDAVKESGMGLDTNTHTHRYVPAQHYYKWTAAPVQTGHTSRYYPVTPKDLKMNRDDLLQCDAYQTAKENAGMDTHTHSSRYVPGSAPRPDQ